MQKVLIISYFYEPCAFVGAERIDYWAQHLHSFGIYPIVVTRNWNPGQLDLTGKVIDNNLKIEKHDGYEVHRLPFKRCLRDRLVKYPFLKIIQKVLTLVELFMSNVSYRFLPYANFYRYSKNLLKNDKEIEKVMASGRPFQIFSIGSKLKKEFDIMWIPDYRDEWNSHIRNTSRNPLGKMIERLEARSEKRWTSNADYFLTVSENWRKSIKALIGKEGMVVKNGYDESLIMTSEKKKSSAELKIVYAGTLYSYQKIEMVISAVCQLVDSPVHMYFVGIEIDPSQKERLLTLTKKASHKFTLLNRLPKKEMKSLFQEMDVGVVTNYDNLEACLPVKIFEYFSSGLAILLIPSDNDLMEGFIQETNSGFIADSIEECKEVILSLLELKVNGEKMTPLRDMKAGEQYSRNYQTKLLGEILHLSPGEVNSISSSKSANG